jgi:hypothetical protein
MRAFKIRIFLGGTDTDTDIAESFLINHILGNKKELGFICENFLFETMVALSKEFRSI